MTTTRSRKRPTTLEVQLDADVYTYNAAFSVEHTEYALVVGGDALRGVYEGKEALDSAVALLPEGAAYEVYSRTYMEEDAEARAKHNVRSQVEGVLDAIRAEYPKAGLVLRPVLTGSGNFRERVATIRPYKGNRSSKPKPRLYHTLRKYLAEVWGADVVHGHEADDEVTIRHMAAGAGSILVHVDKDLLQVPGLHYDPTKGFAEIKPAWGLRFFYRQVIEGDTADNIGGVYKAGKKRASEIITTGMTEEQMAAVCIEEYARSISAHGPEKCGYDDPRKAFLENAELLWMCREHGVTYKNRPDLPASVKEAA